jgi:hypothetical protein
MLRRRRGDIDLPLVPEEDSEEYHCGRGGRDRAACE